LTHVLSPPWLLSAELHERATTRIAADFLNALVKAVPYKIHAVLTDNGTHFTDPGGGTWSPFEIKEMLEQVRPFRAHAFEFACARNDIDHRLTKPKHPWTNGQVERMNRTIKDATVKRYFYESRDQLRTHLADFITAYNFSRGSSPSKASRHTNSSASSRQRSQTDSDSIRSSKCRD
jgi:transposase InsO family protein